MDFGEYPLGKFPIIWFWSYCYYYL